MNWIDRQRIFLVQPREIAKHAAAEVGLRFGLMIKNQHK